MIRARRRLILAAGLCATLLVAAQASARDENLRWQQPSQDTVDNYRVYWGTQTGNYTGHQDVGVPGLDGTGAFSYVFAVPQAVEDLEVFFAVSGWNGGSESNLSNEKSRAAPPPPPPPANIGKPGKPQVILD